jgi:ubiquinone/menaquinone biosynthesis C-methylase UbiE
MPKAENMMSSHDLDSLRFHHDAIRAEYRQQAPRWGKATIGEDLKWVVSQMELMPQFSVLDVAAGTGLFSQAVASRVRHVTAIDITPEMLQHGRSLAQQNGFHNIAFQLGAAEDLPFPANAFDVVISRYSVHHFYAPNRAFKEMSRVCRTGGSVVVVDIVAAEDPVIAARHNDLERLADPTHTRILPSSEFQKEIGQSDLVITEYLSREVEMPFDSWQSQIPSDSEVRLKIKRALEDEMSGGLPTGMHPFEKHGALRFWHTWGIVTAKKPSTPSFAA